jgi:hypothetical protein
MEVVLIKGSYLIRYLGVQVLSRCLTQTFSFSEKPTGILLYILALTS